MDFQTVKIADHLIGDGQSCFIIAEIGINHNGDVKIAKQLIDSAKEAGCDAVKFQKRTVEVVYSQEELERVRPNPFGSSNGDLKRGLEFDKAAYEKIDIYCKEKDIMWFTSCWDKGSVDFMEDFDPPCYKIASAQMTNDELLRYHREKGKPIILSTGMSDLSQIHHAVDVLGQDDLVILHCTSSYPSSIEELNLRGILTLKKEFKCPVGYSGHEVGLSTSIAAAAIGACVIERHITINRAMWGSDQAASVEPPGLKRLVRDIGAIEAAMGDGEIKVYESEMPIMNKLRKVT